MVEAEEFDVAYEQYLRSEQLISVDEKFSWLLKLTKEIGESFSEQKLSSTSRTNIYAKALTMADVKARNKVHKVVNWVNHRRPEVIGGAAVITTVATIWVLRHGKRQIPKTAIV